MKSYKSVSPENLYLKAKTDSDVKVAVDIYKVDKACKLSYQGTVEVGNKLKKVGVPIGNYLYLVVSFSKSSYWSGQSSSMSSEALLKPEKGYRYQMDLSYEDAIYDISLKQIHPKSGQSKIIEQISIDSCGK